MLHAMLHATFDRIQHLVPALGALRRRAPDRFPHSCPVLGPTRPDLSDNMFVLLLGPWWGDRWPAQHVDPVMVVASRSFPRPGRFLRWWWQRRRPWRRRWKPSWPAAVLPFFVFVAAKDMLLKAELGLGVSKRADVAKSTKSPLRHVFAHDRLVFCVLGSVRGSGRSGSWYSCGGGLQMLG